MNQAQPLVARHLDGVVLDFPVAPQPGARRWVATVYPDPAIPRGGYGWGRELWAPVGRGFKPSRLLAGDVVEFGADHPVPAGRKKTTLVPNRWYGFVTAVDDEALVLVGPYPGPRAAHQAAYHAMAGWRRQRADAADASRIAQLATPTVDRHAWDPPSVDTRLPPSTHELARECRQLRDQRHAAGGTLDEVDQRLAATQQRHDDFNQQLEAARRHVADLQARPAPNKRAITAAENELAAWEQRAQQVRHNLDLLQNQRREATPTGVDHDRYELLAGLLDGRVAAAIDAARRQPPGYINELLGRRPGDRQRAATWDQRVADIEAWRHRELGLDSARPAAATGVERAIGPRPSGPAAARWDVVAHNLPGHERHAGHVPEAVLESGL